MGQRLRRKQRGQIAIIAPFAVISLLGILGLVIDIGVFRLIDSELENAADAAALAAAWYDPVCPDDPTSPGTYDPRCDRPDNKAGEMYNVAPRYAKLNWGLAAALCGSAPEVTGVLPGFLQAPKARAVTVVIQCRAGYLAGSILGLGSTDITRWATAGLGNTVPWTDADGTVRANLDDYVAPPAGFNPAQPPFLIARLVPE